MLFKYGNKGFVSFAVGLSLLGSSVVHAAVNVDRTRIVMGGEDKSLAITLSNQSKTQPYLAQSWVDDASGKRSEVFTGVTAPTAYRCG